MTLLHKIVNFLLFKPFHLAIGYAMIACSVLLKRDAFCVHVFGVTFFLLVVLHKINMCYGIMENKFRYYEYVVLAGGVVHAFVPVIGLFYEVAMLVHIGLCFCVHVLHLLQCYQVFNDMKMKDNQYIFILWYVNIAEFAVNLAFALPFISDDVFVVFLVVVETSALLISSLKLSAKGTSGFNASNSSDMLEKGVTFATSRVFLLFWSCIMVAFVTAYNKHSYIFFVIGSLGLSLIAYSKFQERTRSLPTGTFALLFGCTVMTVPVLAALTSTGVLDRSVGVILVFLCSCPLLAMMLYTGQIVLGNHFSWHVGIVFLLLLMASHILYAILSNDIPILMECCTIATGMIFCLLDNRERKVVRKEITALTGTGTIHPEEL
jgi:hypothetical protein